MFLMSPCTSPERKLNLKYWAESNLYSPDKTFLSNQIGNILVSLLLIGSIFCITALNFRL